MNSLLLSILLWLWDNRSFDTIEANNRAKIIAERAFKEQKYQLAIVNYQKIIRSSLLVEPALRLNLANALFEDNKLKEAQQQYRRLTKLSDLFISSQAQMQLGLIEVQQKDTAAALVSLKKSLKINSYNNIARFNFELLKSQYSNHTAAREPKPKPVNTTIAPQKISVQTVETEQKKDILERLNSIKMTEAQAITILDAMQTSEIQYLQQRRQKSTNIDTGKW